MEKRFSVLPKIRQKLNYILNVFFGLHSVVDIIAGCLHGVLAHCILKDLALFDWIHEPIKNPERNPGFV